MVWESKEAFQRWAGEHKGAAHERACDRGWQAPPEVLDFETYHVMT